jgi:hypothetical protein
VRSLLHHLAARWARRFWPALAALLLGAAGCGDVDAGSVSFPGTVVYQSPSGAYHFHLLEPPWIALSVNGQDVFLVPATDIAVSVSVMTQETDALYSLLISGQAGDAATNFQEHASVQSPPWDLSQKHDITPVGGDAGVEISWQEAPAVYHREADINGSTAGTSFLLRFTSKQPLDDDPMIDQMVLSFQPRPSEAGSP